MNNKYYQEQIAATSHLSLWSLIITCCVILLYPHNLAISQTTTNMQRPVHHTEDGLFQNPGAEPAQKRRGFSFRNMSRFYKAMRSIQESAIENNHLVPQIKINLETIHNPGQQPLVTWIGHSTVLVQYNNINVITDPIFTKYCGPVGFVSPKRITVPALTAKQLPRIDYVLISHNHYDHLDLAAVRALGNQPLWLVPLGVKAWLIRVGIDEKRIVELDWWQQYDRQQRSISVTATPTRHWSGRGLFDRNRTLWNSWHFRIKDFNFWFGGDTGYDETMFRSIGEKLPPADIAFIPIGAYEPRSFMQGSHVNPAEAVQIYLDIKAKSAMGIHWGTFILSREGLMSPVHDLEQAKQDAAPATIKFDAKAIGQSFTLPLNVNTSAK